MERHFIRREREFKADVAVVWELISDFGGWGRWLPDGGDDAFAASYVKSSEPVTERSFDLGEGPDLLEVLKASDDEARSLSYSIEAGPMPIQNHLATISVTDLGGGMVRVNWNAEFDATAEVGAQMEQFMGEQAFTPGLAGLESRAQKLSE